MPSPAQPAPWRQLAARMGHFFALMSSGALAWTGNTLLLGAVAVEFAILAGFLLIPPVASVLGHATPPVAGFAIALLIAPAVLAADALHRWTRARRHRGDDAHEPARLTPP